MIPKVHGCMDEVRREGGWKLKLGRDRDFGELEGLVVAQMIWIWAR